MKDAHRGRGIQKMEFDRVFEHVVTTMQDLGVPEDLMNEVGGALESFRADVT